MALGAPRRDFNRRKNAPNALSLACKVLAAMRKAEAALFEVLLVLLPSLLPPETLFPGHNPSQEANCFGPFHRLKSSPTSEIIFKAVDER